MPTLSIYLTTGQLVREGKPMWTPEEAHRDADERNRRAERMGIDARYVAK